ncbi:MAG TPA: hypothetical protein VF171_03860 [Trueperaceae bacterium]
MKKLVLILMVLVSGLAFADNEDVTDPGLNDASIPVVRCAA